MGRPIRVRDVPYAYGMVLQSHTRMGVLYAYGIDAYRTSHTRMHGTAAEQLYSYLAIHTRVLVFELSTPAWLTSHAV